MLCRQKSEIEPMLIHTVYFWMADTATPADRDRIVADCRELLTPIPTVRSLHAGIPANTPPRDVVDGSFGVGLTVIFDDVAGSAVYDTHPKHLEFIERNKHAWARVVVYDTLV